MVVGGLPEPMEDHAERIINLTLAMQEAASALPRSPLTLRIGVHSGPVAGGVIGRRRFAYDVWGDTVNVAARLEQQGVPGRVQVSEATRHLVDGRYQFEPRGLVELRGHEAVQAYLVVSEA